MNFYKSENFENLESFSPKPKRRRFFYGVWIFVLLALAGGVTGILLYKTSFTFSQMNTERLELLPTAEEEPTPTPDPERINILLLGLRGEDDPNGGLLTDSLMVLSFKKNTKEIALISIPRDLYVKMPGENYKEKINFAYALGYEKRNGAAGGLLYSKIAVSKVTGLNIAYAAAVNHEAFREIVDALGGIDLTLEKPFVEDQQWVQGGDLGSSPFFSIRVEIASTSQGAVETQKMVFEIPAGKSHLGGNSVLYYVRARYSSSDFDRIQRQQKVLMAAKNKALSLGILANPLKVYQLLEALGKNVRLDMTFNELKELISLGMQAETQNIRRKVFDTTPEGLLYETHTESGIYVLLPQGDNFDRIHEACLGVFN